MTHRYSPKSPRFSSECACSSAPRQGVPLLERDRRLPAEGLQLGGIGMHEWYSCPRTSGQVLVLVGGPWLRSPHAGPLGVSAGAGAFETGLRGAVRLLRAIIVDLIKPREARNMAP